MPKENSFEALPGKFDVREEEAVLEGARPELRMVLELATRKAMEQAPA